MPEGYWVLNIVEPAVGYALLAVYALLARAGFLDGVNA